MARAQLADSDRTVKVEANHYFPPESLRREHFAASPATSTCPWKGQARYYHVPGPGQEMPGGTGSSLAGRILGRLQRTGARP